jgi:hypothetical protein
MAEPDDDLHIGASDLALFNSLVVCDVTDGKWKVDALGTVSGPRGTFRSFLELLNAVSETTRISDQVRKSYLRLSVAGGSGGTTPTFDVPSYDGEVKPSHPAPEMTGTGTARKASMVDPDETVNADWIRTYDVRNPAEFLFAILTFLSGESTPQLIGSGSWLTLVTYTATYKDSEPSAAITSASVSLFVGTDLSGAFPIAMTGPGFTTSPATVVDIQWPLVVGGTVVFRLSATHPSVGTITLDETITFLNNRYRGVRSSPLPATGAWTAGDVAALTGLVTEVSNDIENTYVAASTGTDFDVYVIRDALGTPTLKINEFNIEPQDGGIVSITNANGFTEDYRVWILENCNMTGATIEWSS